MDINGRNPQPGMRPGDTPPQRPQGYDTPVNRPSVDGFSAPTQPTNAPVNPIAPTPNQPEPAQQPEQQQSNGPQVLEPTNNHRSSKPVILAVITLLIAAGLGVAAFFAFRPETAPAPNRVNIPTDQTSQQQSTSTEEAVDSATSDINKQTDSLNDTQDFADSELNDQTLGL